MEPHLPKAHILFIFVISGKILFPLHSSSSSPPPPPLAPREVSKHTPELAQLLVNVGGVAAIIDYLGESAGAIRLPGIMTLGYVAAHSENLAMSVIVSKGVSQLAICLGWRCKRHE